MLAITAMPFDEDIRVLCLKLIELRVMVGWYIHYVTSAEITLGTSTNIFYIIVVYQGTVCVTYVCVNHHHSEAWHRRRYFISGSISNNSNCLMKPPVINSYALSIQDKFLFKIWFQICILI